MEERAWQRLARAERSGRLRCQVVVGPADVLRPRLVDATVQRGRQRRLRARGTKELSWVDALVGRARAGDLDAFEQLAERSLPEVYRLATALVGPDDARDVAQEALVATWRELPSLRDPARYDAWLRSIVLNRARNLLRGRRRRPTVSLITDHIGFLAEERTAESQRRLDLEAALAGMTAPHREVLGLHYIADLPLREVAAALRIPEGTAKSRLNAALRELRARLPDGDEQ